MSSAHALRASAARASRIRAKILTRCRIMAMPPSIGDAGHAAARSRAVARPSGKRVAVPQPLDFPVPAIGRIARALHALHDVVVGCAVELLLHAGLRLPAQPGALVARVVPGPQARLRARSEVRAHAPAV